MSTDFKQSHFSFMLMSPYFYLTRKPSPLGGGGSKWLIFIIDSIMKVPAANGWGRAPHAMVGCFGGWQLWGRFKCHLLTKAPLHFHSWSASPAQIQCFRRGLGGGSRDHPIDRGWRLTTVTGLVDWSLMISWCYIDQTGGLHDSSGKLPRGICFWRKVLDGQWIAFRK